MAALGLYQAELCSGNRLKNYLAHKTQRIYYLVLYRKTLGIPVSNPFDGRCSYARFTIKFQIHSKAGLGD